MRETTPPASLDDGIRSIVREHSKERGPLLVVLHAIQQRLGHVPPAAVPVIASELNLSRAEVHGVVTFYRDFRSEPAPVARIRVCRAEACAAVGGDALLASLQDALGVAIGGTTSDGTALEEVFCLGNCALGPAAEVDGRVHGRVDRDRALALVAESRP